MKIIMFGAGVINTLYGHALAEAGNDVTHYVRPGKKKMFENGIQLNFLDGRANPPKQVSAHYQAQIVEEFSSPNAFSNCASGIGFRYASESPASRHTL